MGLDIHLRKCADLAAATAAEQASAAEQDANWNAGGGYDSMTEEQKAEVRAKNKEVEKKHGCTGKYGKHHTIEELDEVVSAIDPEHMFKIGYFRSSCNGAGIERVMRRLGLPTLRDIFQPNDEYEFKPDWDEALLRVNKAIEGYQAHLASDMGNFTVTEVRPLWDRGVSSEKDALKLFSEQLASHKPGEGFDHYSNADGEFMMSGMKVHAIITKKYEPPRDGNPISRMLNTPSVFVVYEKTKGDDGKEDWYLTALRIVRESIEYVISQPDRQHFYLVWSG